MSKIKMIFFLTLSFVFYKGYEAFTDFEIGVSDRIVELEEAADFERQGEVIALMMYLGDPPELKEHLFTKSRAKCLELKEIAETTSNAYYECAKVNAVLKGRKIVSVIEENCAEADAIATGLLAMNIKDIIKFSDENNIASMLIYKADNNFVKKYSKNFKKYLISE